MNKVLSVLTIAVASAIAMPAMAETVTTSMNVNVDVLTGCRVQSTSDLWTGYDQGAGTDMAGESNLWLECATGVPFTVSYGEGQNPAAGSSCLSPQRRAANFDANSFVRYDLYQDGGYSQVLGCDESNQIASVASGGSMTLPIYWRIAADQPEATQSGFHSDNVVVTITF